MKLALWSRLAIGIHSAGNIICFLCQCHFSSSVYEMESGSLHNQHSMAHLQVPIICGGCAYMIQKQFFPPVTKRKQTHQIAYVDKTFVCVLNFFTLRLFDLILCRHSLSLALRHCCIYCACFVGCLPSMWRDLFVLLVF